MDRHWGCAGWGVAALLGLFAVAQCSAGDSSGNSQSEPGFMRYVSPRSLNCREEPRRDAAVRRGLKRGDGIVVVEERDGWARIDKDGSCWVSALYLSHEPPAGAAAAGGAAVAGVAGAGLLTDDGRDGSAAGQDPGSSRVHAANRADRSSVTGRAARKRSGKARRRATSKPRYDGGGYDCPCSGSRVCIGPRGGRYCITSGGNKRYGV